MCHNDNSLQITSTEIYGTVSLDELNWFYHTCTSFSYGITSTNLQPYVRRNIIMSLDNYIFSVFISQEKLISLFQPFGTALNQEGFYFVVKHVLHTFIPHLHISGEDSCVGIVRKYTQIYTVIHRQSFIAHFLLIRGHLLKL